MNPRLTSLASMPIVKFEETCHQPYGEAWWWQHHAVGMFFSGRDWETSQDRGKDEQSKVQRERSFMKTCSRALRTSDWGRRFTFHQDNNPKHTAQTMQEGLQDKPLNFLEWPN